MIKILEGRIRNTHAGQKCVQVIKSKTYYNRSKNLVQKQATHMKITANFFTFSLTFSKEDGDTTEKHTRNTSVCG